MIGSRSGLVRLTLRFPIFRKMDLAKVLPTRRSEPHAFAPVEERNQAGLNVRVNASQFIAGPPIRTGAGPSLILGSFVHLAALQGTPISSRTRRPTHPGTRSKLIIQIGQRAIPNAFPISFQMINGFGQGVTRRLITKSRQTM